MLCVGHLVKHAPGANAVTDIGLGYQRHYRHVRVTAQSRGSSNLTPEMRAQLGEAVPYLATGGRLLERLPSHRVYTTR